MLQSLCVAPFFWSYFYLFTTQSRFDTANEQLVLKHKWPLAGPVTCWLAIIAMAPLLALMAGIKLTGTTAIFGMSMAMIVLIDPFTIASPVEPSPQAYWAERTCVRLMGSLFKWIFTLLLTGLIWLALKLPIMPSVSSQQKFIDSLLGWGPRLPGCVNLPPAFYYFCFVMLIIRAIKASSANPPFIGPNVKYFATILIGVAALKYFYFITGLMVLPAGSWDAPVAGLFASLLFKAHASQQKNMHNDLGEEHAKSMRW